MCSLLLSVVVSALVIANSPPIGITATLLLHHHQCLDSMGGFCLRRYQHLYPWFILLQVGVQSPKRLCTVPICYCNKWLLNSKYPSLVIEIASLISKYFSFFFFHRREHSWNLSLSKELHGHECFLKSVAFIHLFNENFIHARGTSFCHTHTHTNITTKSIFVIALYLERAKDKQAFFRGRWKRAGVIVREEEKLGREVMIRSDPNYVGEREPHIWRGRRREGPYPTDTNVLLSFLNIFFYSF